jgi:hypothetical protein
LPLLALADATIRITHSTITGNLTGVAASSGGIVASLGDNSLRGGTTNGTTTSTVALQ